MRFKLLGRAREVTPLQLPKAYVPINSTPLLIVRGNVCTFVESKVAYCRYAAGNAEGGKGRAALKGILSYAGNCVGNSDGSKV